ncbi:endo-alpha-N-acetylgalactosaminidase family protein [Clostridium sp.]|uniref:endo-alpha-N-acetylgalactosaminidase family protein n=1 Tax=Clostridium sp. TaxID=1506 RepID=UPI00261A8A0A|nr:endo-alpha-N-acetylgalactosaminidase family protein [Clostridium sp.]
MIKNKSMNRKIALIIATAVTVGQIPVSALAENNTTMIVENSAVEKASEEYAYSQEYDDFSSTSWTNLIGNGSINKNMDNDVPGTEGKKGYLEISRDATADNKLVFLEDQSPSIKDFEAEVRFQLNPEEGKAAGRFGLVFRGKDANNYGFIGYNGGETAQGKWLIETPTAWKDDIEGPTIEAGQWVTMKVKVQRNNVTLTVDDSEIFNGTVDIGGFPQEAGKFGYRTWFDNKSINVDYLKVKSLDNEVVTDIQEVEELNISTLLKTKPELPYKVNVTYSDGTTGEEVVIWDYIDPSKYAEVGNFVVEGTIKGAAEGTPKAKANVTVREKIEYSTDFETPETSGDWKTLSGGGAVTVEDGVVKIGMNAKSIAADMASPDVKNFIYEAEFTTSSDDGRIGLGFRVKDATNWGAVCYDAGSWVWKASTNGTESYGSFPGSKKLEANKTYKMKLEVEDNNITLSIDGEVIGSATSDKLPTTAGKIGLVGWFGNKTVTLDNVKVNEITPETDEDLPEVTEKTIESDIMTVKLDNTFPRVIEYNWKDDGSTLIGQETRSNKVNLNGKNYTPKVDCVVEGNKATYTMAIDEIGVTLTAVMSVEDNKIRLEITNIEETGEFIVKKVSLPNQSFAEVRSDNGGAIAAVLSTGAWHEISDEISTVEDLDPSSKAKTYAFINDNDFAVSLNNNVIEYSSRILLNTENRNGYKSTSIGTGAWTYREVLDSESDVDFYSHEENLWAEAYITKDMNEDKTINWQDAAIEYRNRTEAPLGAEDLKNSLSYIAFNIGYTQSPFLRTLDTVKKLYNYTDGFGQMVLEKGYQSEGHDDSIPDYGGHIGIRQGGVEDFNTLIEEGAKYNAKFGVHINATEYQLDAFQYPDNGSVNTNAPGWNWLDQAYYVDQRADLTTGELFRRLDMLKADLPNLGWVYVDVYTGNGWNAHQLGEKLNALGYQVATEFHSPLEEHVTWTHWGADPAYPNKGGTSEILRFIRNSTKDGFLSDPILKGNKHLLSSGWGNNHAIEGVNGIERFYNQVLPTKYMQHFEIMSRTDDEVKFTDNLVGVREGANINYYKNDKLVATTPESSYNTIGEGKTKLFLEWNFDEEEDTKIYHWNPLGTSSEWELPDGWENLSTVEVYELTDLGREHVKSVPVVNGKVQLDVEQSTPYLVTKGEVAEERIDDWGYGSQIKDPGFDSQEWKTWTKDSEDGNTDHISFVNEEASRRAGNDVVSISNKQGSISQRIEGLESGKTYSISAWVKNDGNRKVTLGVNCGDEELTNVITREAFARSGEGHKYLEDTFQRMEIEVTVPENVTTADIYLNAEAGEGDVIVDDFRIWEHPGNTNKDGYVFYEDFENVDEGITPFFLAPGRGTSNRSHLAEKDLLGRQKMTWVLDGRFSLKTNQQAGETGQMLVTDDSTFKLEPNKTYELGFLYSLKDATPGYTVNIKSRSEGTLVSIPLEATGVEEGQYTKTSSKSKTFTTGNNDDYYISIDKGNGYADLILDDIYVVEIDESIENPVIDRVTLGSSITEIGVDESIDLSLLSIKALMNNGAPANIGDGKIEYVVGNNEVAKIEDGKLVGLKDGNTTLAVNISINDKKVTSNTINIKVGEGSEDGGEVTPPVEDVCKQHLEIAIEEANKITDEELSNVVPAVAEEFKAALSEAKALLESGKYTQDQVDKAFDRLSTVMQMLSFEKGNKEQLQQLVDKINKLDASEYIDSTWAKLQVALGKANEVIADKNALEVDVAKSYDQLIRSFLELRLKPNKDKLQDLINKAESLDSSKYTEKSWKVLEDKLAKAKTVMENGEATAEDVSNSEKELMEAMDGLVIADSGNNNGNDGSNNSDNNNGNSNNNNSGNSNNGNKGNSNLPKTGGTSSVAVGLFGTIIATIGSVMFKKKK